MLSVALLADIRELLIYM